MEDRVAKLEKSVGEINVEMKMMNVTLKTIAETLREFKQISTDVSEIKTDVALLNQQAEQEKGKVIALFKKATAIETIINSLTKEDIKQNVQIGNFERAGWVIFTVVLTLISNYFKGDTK